MASQSKEALSLAEQVAKLQESSQEVQAEAEVSVEDIEAAQERLRLERERQMRLKVELPASMAQAKLTAEDEMEINEEAQALVESIRSVDIYAGQSVDQVFEGLIKSADARGEEVRAFAGQMKALQTRLSSNEAGVSELMAMEAAVRSNKTSEDEDRLLNSGLLKMVLPGRVRSFLKNKVDEGKANMSTGAERVKELMEGFGRAQIVGVESIVEMNGLGSQLHIASKNLQKQFKLLQTVRDAMAEYVAEIAETDSEKADEIGRIVSRGLVGRQVATVTMLGMVKQSSQMIRLLKDTQTALNDQLKDTQVQTEVSMSLGLMQGAQISQQKSTAKMLDEINAAQNAMIKSLTKAAEENVDLLEKLAKAPLELAKTLEDSSRRLETADQKARRISDDAVKNGDQAIKALSGVVERIETREQSIAAAQKAISEVADEVAGKAQVGAAKIAGFRKARGDGSEPDESAPAPKGPGA